MNGKIDGSGKIIVRSIFSLKNISINDIPNHCKDILVIGSFLFILLIAFSYGIGNVSATSGGIIYVNTHGNDNWNGQSPVWDGLNGPKKSIKNATGIVNKGGTVNIANGRYSGAKNTKITINKNIIIKGQSKSGTIINGKGNNWIFLIKHGISVSISNITLINGKSSKGGGAVTNYGSLKVKNIDFTNNTAYGGGALFNYIGGKVTAEDCTFNGNNAIFGGAIENAGKMTVSRSKFTVNKAKDGGAIDNADNLTLTMNKLIGNHATEDGGAISNYEGNLYIHFNYIIKNTAKHGNAILHGMGIAYVSLNWWGTNKGPLSNVLGNLKVQPWLVLNITANPRNIDDTYNITVDLLHDSNKIYHNPAMGHIPDGIPVRFNTTLGNIKNPVYTANGVSQAVLVVKDLSGIADVSAVLDGQTVRKLVNIDPPLTITNLKLLNMGKCIPVKIIKITFSESIKAGTMKIKLKNIHGKKLFTIKSISNNILTIIPILPLKPGNYILILNYGCLTDVKGNSFKSYKTNFTVPKTIQRSSHERNSYLKFKYRLHLKFQK